MREGMNPNRRAGVKGYANIILGVITHLPNEEAHHAGRFDVIKASLELSLEPNISRSKRGSYRYVPWRTFSAVF